MIIVYVDVFLSLNGAVIPDHGYVAISDIGFSDNNALLCNTNLRGFPTSGGWYAPNRTRVIRNSGHKVVRLKRAIGITTPEGIYWCSIEDAAYTLQTVYVGLYNPGGGKSVFLNAGTILFVYSGHLVLSGDITFILHNDNSFILTCISTGGPATTVTWTRDSTTVTQGTQTVLNGGVTAQYTHTLTDRTAGLYTCLITNDVSNVSTKLLVQGEIEQVP